MLKPSEHLQKDFEQNYRDYISDPTIEWKAKNVMQAAYNHLEWTFKYYRETDLTKLPGNKSLSDFRNYIYSQCPDARMMQELAEAAKHRFLTRPGKIITSSTGAQEMNDGDLVIRDYNNRSFKEAINEVYSFWKNRQD